MKRFKSLSLHIRPLQNRGALHQKEATIAKESSERKALKKEEKRNLALEAIKAKYPHEKIPSNKHDYFQGSVWHRRKLFTRDYEPHRMLKIITWNVASLRGICTKHKQQLDSLFQSEKPDILCIQETKLSSLSDCHELAQYNGYSFFDSISTAKKGYSGTRTYVKKLISNEISHTTGFMSPRVKQCEHGRVTTTHIKLHNAWKKVHHDLHNLCIVNTYVPTSGLDKSTGTFPKLGERLRWDEELRYHFADIFKNGKSDSSPLIWTGDFNVLFDLDHFWKSDYLTMLKTPGFSFEERKSFQKTLGEIGLVECYRHLYPKSAGAYTFWSHFERSRVGNRGLRLDGFAISKHFVDRVVETHSLQWVTASDHCPVSLWIAVD